jgi:hypothetical protein
MEWEPHDQDQSPTSDSDERPSAHTPKARRAESAWEALPADSTSELDYPAED